MIHDVSETNRIYLSEDSWMDTFKLPLGVDFKKLMSIKPEERGKVLIYGKLLNVPRFQKSYNRDYSFSNLNHKSEQLPDEFKPYFDWAKSLSLYDGNKFNQVLVNWYINGHSYIGSHSDDESQLFPDSPILSISLGAERKFRIRDRQKKIVKDVLLSDKTVVVMGGKFQKEFKHEIVKINGKKGELVGSRINITMRQFLK